MESKKDLVPVHEVALIFPEMETMEYRELVENIRANGLREEIWLNDGKIIDGKHRYRACLEAGVEPRFREWDGKGSLVQFVVGINLYRRHLTSSQKAAIALKIVPMLKVEAKKRQGTRTDITDFREKFPVSSFGRSYVKATEIVKGTNPRYIYDAAKILNKDPNILKLVEMGKVKIPEAKTLINLPEEMRLRIYNDFKSGEIKTFSEISKKTKPYKYRPRPELYERALEELKRWYKKWHNRNRKMRFIPPNFRKLERVFREIEALTCDQPFQEMKIN